MNELKPCPFCGSTDFYVVQARIEEYHSIEPEISCKKCRYTIKLNELAIAIDESPKTNADRWDRCAAKKWNRRPAEEALKAENAELRYIVEQFFDDWYCEDGCPKQKDKKFPCSGEEENETTAEFYPGECSFYQTKCWVEYYRWQYRQKNNAHATVAKGGGEDEP